jgi:hypothetical protein
VFVANARKLRAISESHTKSDVEDARLLARLGRADPVLLGPIQHRSEQRQRALVRLKVHEALVRARVNAMNSVRFLLNSLGLVVPSGSKATTFTRRLRPMLDEATGRLVEPLLVMVDTLNAKIAELDDELEAFGRERYPVTERLRQVDGVGPLTALAYVLTIEDPNGLRTRATSARTWAWCPSATSRAKATSSCRSARPAIGSCDACWSIAPTISSGRSVRRRDCVRRVHALRPGVASPRRSAR